MHLAYLVAREPASEPPVKRNIRGGEIPLQGQDLGEIKNECTYNPGHVDAR